jgi:hypothetical protein
MTFDRTFSEVDFVGDTSFISDFLNLLVLTLEMDFREVERLMEDERLLLF